MLALLPVVAAHAAPGVTLPSRRPLLPEVRIAQPQRQDAAIQALGRDLPGVAAHYRMTPERLTQMLRQDRTAWIDTRGRLFFVDEFPALPADLAAATTPAAADATLDLSRTFLLHSKPGAARVVYLDFNGHSASGTVWGAGTINAPPFDLDGDPSSFNAAEQTVIQKVWQRVAEDYAPFNLDITTEAPAADALLRSSSVDDRFGMRAVITRNGFYRCSCAGVAYVGVFDSFENGPGYYQPAWIFYDAAGSQEKYIAEAVSHEVGHTLGLSHDGTATSPYYEGQGSGATGWAAIMGASYYRELTQWSRGEYAGANNREDDLALLPTNGAPVRSDAVGNGRSTAAMLAGSSFNGVVSVQQRGLIETAGDLDMFRFATAGGHVHFDVTPAPLGADLDIAASLYNAAGMLLLQANPVDALDAHLDTTLAAGTYYLRVEGTGNPAAGYPGYASLGQYRIGGSYSDAQLQAPLALGDAGPLSGNAPLTVNFTGSGSRDPDGSIASYLWDFGDGSTSRDADPSHSYTVAGRYPATLTVTDAQGLAAMRRFDIAVAPESALAVLYVSDISLRVVKRYDGSFRCIATVAVQSGVGAAAGASVTAVWSGVGSKTNLALTDASGVVTLKGPAVFRHGTCSVAIGNLALPGYTYTPDKNLEGMDSLTY